MFLITGIDGSSVMVDDVCAAEENYEINNLTILMWY